MNDLSGLAGNTPLDLGQLRTRLQKMSDAQLLEFGRAARYMCTPEANIGKPPREEFVIQLAEARAEWKRRKGPA
jgi:hypothetical protein